jgi:predicted flap endonuclease-1-like 5' DNA nuclease
MANLIDVEGIGEVYRQKLVDAGIATTEDLLEAGKTPGSRQKLADKTGISRTLILEWVNHVDLFRIKGVGEEYADLLEEAGVDTVVELAQRNAENLYRALVEAGEHNKLVRRVPAQSQVSDWIEEAKTLPRVVTY